MTSGVPAAQLSDEQLRHDLAHLKGKQHDIAQDGTADQQRNHADRTAELEAEFVRRFGAPGDGSDGAHSSGTDSTGGT
ncbi:MAG TPA: DUF6158 family protein [Jatrophihabitans sp.]|nr:DUF6158 family protein [Jatrophihabitans sp.]